MRSPVPAPLSARPRPTGPRRRRRSERGGVIVELAMVAPILIMLIMGIVDFTTLFNQKIGLRGGVQLENGFSAFVEALFGSLMTRKSRSLVTPERT